MKTPHQLVEEWNAKHPPGTLVYVGSSSKTAGFQCRTTCKAYVLDPLTARALAEGHSQPFAVVEVTGMAAWVDLSVVRPVALPAEKAPRAPCPAHVSFTPPEAPVPGACWMLRAAVSAPEEKLHYRVLGAGWGLDVTGKACRLVTYTSLEAGGTRSCSEETFTEGFEPRPLAGHYHTLAVQLPFRSKLSEPEAQWLSGVADTVRPILNELLARMAAPGGVPETPSETFDRLMAELERLRQVARLAADTSERPMLRNMASQALEPEAELPAGVSAKP